MMTWRRLDGMQEAQKGEGIFFAGRGLGDHGTGGYDRLSLHTRALSSRCSLTLYQSG